MTNIVPIDSHVHPHPSSSTTTLRDFDQVAAHLHSEEFENI